MGVRLAKTLFQSAPRSLQRHLEACFGEGFEQVIQGIEIKGSNGMLIVSGGENNDWNRAWPKGLEHLEAVEARHLHIQKKQVWLAFLRLLECLRAVGALGNDFHVRLILKK